MNKEGTNGIIAMVVLNGHGAWIIIIIGIEKSSLLKLLLLQQLRIIIVEKLHLLLLSTSIIKAYWRATK